MEYILEIDSVQLSFGKRDILKNIYVKSETGKITGILGRNGCGKSCLLKLIFGEIQTREKSVRINGRPLIEDYRNSDEIRMLPQFNFLPRFVRINQMFKTFDLNFSEFCELFNEFDKWSNFKVKELSGGNIRILETYLILKSKTKFCILDEPFSHLSPKNVTVFTQIINEEKRNKGIILTDHLYNHIANISDDLYVIKDCSSYKVKNYNDLKKYGYIN